MERYILQNILLLFSSASFEKKYSFDYPEFQSLRKNLPSCRTVDYAGSLSRETTYNSEWNLEMKWKESYNSWFGKYAAIFEKRGKKYSEMCGAAACFTMILAEFC